MENQDRLRAIELFDIGVAAADPAQAVARSLAARPPAKPRGRLILLAMGKAAGAMAAEVQNHVEAAQTLVVTHDPNHVVVPGARVLVGAHPVPDHRSLHAAEAIEAMLSGVGVDDTVLALISGGASSLVCAPVDGVGLDDKILVNRMLLGAGLDIGAMNLVRQNLSRLKGGGLLRQAAPAPVTALILSDVIGNDLRMVASGPTAARLGGPREARRVLQGACLWAQMPPAVQAALQGPDGSNPDAPGADNRLIGSNEQSVAAMARAAPGAHLHGAPLIGDVADAAEILATKGPGCHLFGGETTVHLAGDGLGGRNQELALRLAILAEQADWPPGWVFLSGGTDGRDGPTDAAGGLVDGGSLARMRANGVDPQAALANNDSYHALKASDDLLLTGATGTNVADLQVLIRP